MATTYSPDKFQELGDQLSGAILLPSDPAYAEKRLAWNRSVDQYPALIVIPESVEDVQAAVRFANAHDLGIAMQLTGHGIKYAADGNMLILTAKLNHVSVDVAARTARVQGGALWQEVLDVVTPHGLAPLMGTSPHVGVVGYTLGGGVGWLARRYGLAIDSVHWIELVTPDGELRRCSPTENSELFWGLLGGGGNFGVVTALEFALYPVATLYGGVLTYPGALAQEALRFYRDWLKSIPDELTTHFAILKFPDLPQLPDAMRGKIFALVRAAYVGDAADGEALMRPWLAWQPPLQNTLRELPYAEIATISNDNLNPTPTHPTNDMLTELSDAAIEIIVRNATNSQSPLVYNELRHVGGAVARGGDNATAFSNRDAQFYFTIGGISFTPEVHAAMDRYIARYKAELRPYLHGGIYLNFSETEETLARVQDAYAPSSYRRLLALKAQVDPKNLFRYSYPLVAQTEG